MIRKGNYLAASAASSIDCVDYDDDGCPLNLVQGQYKDECDINVILSRYSPEQLQERYAAFNGVFGDYGDVMDYSTARQFVIDADEAFMGLPAHIREKFGNDPEVLCDFLSDPSNLDDAVSMGLVSKPDVSPVAEKVQSDATE